MPRPDGTIWLLQVAAGDPIAAAGRRVERRVRPAARLAGAYEAPRWSRWRSSVLLWIATMSI